MLKHLSTFSEKNSLFDGDKNGILKIADNPSSTTLLVQSGLLKKGDRFIFLLK